LPGQAPKPKLPPSTTVQPVKAELRDFRALDASRPGRFKGIFALILVFGFAAAAFDAVYRSVPHQKEISTEGLTGVVRVDVSGQSAMVTVTPEFLSNPEAAIPRLVGTLREREVKKAMLVLPNGVSAGVIDVASGKAIGLRAPPRGSERRELGDVGGSVRKHDFPVVVVAQQRRRAGRRYVRSKPRERAADVDGHTARVEDVGVPHAHAALWRKRQIEPAGAVAVPRGRQSDRDRRIGV